MDVVNQPKQKAGFNWKHFLRKYGIVFVLLIMIIVISIGRPKFLSPTNLFNVLMQCSIFGILALGVTLVIISKGIDLSLGSVLALSGVVAASLAQMPGVVGKFYPDLGLQHAAIPIIVGLLVALLCGTISGSLIALTGIPAFIATLGMYTVARGLAFIYTSGRPISSLSQGYTMFGSIPWPVIVYAIMIVFTWIMLNYTRFGKSVYALGGNIKAAEVSGIPVKRNLILIYAFCGLTAGVAALVFAGRAGSVHPGAAVGYELTAIAASTIGGTSHSGGIGTVFGAVIGALIIGVLRNGLTLWGVPAYWQQVVEGVIIVVAVIIDMKTHVQKK